MNEILRSAVESQKKYLNAIIDGLSVFETENKIKVLPFNINDINTTEKIVNLSVDLPSKGKCLYFISVDSYEVFHTCYENLETGFAKNNRLPKLNTYEKGLTFLYVGSSNSLKKRFKEHCGLTSDTTYALKFNKWFTNEFVKINFNYLILPENTSQLILQNLEDAIWRDYKPLFGKSGGNNKS